jgi:hypothetical protein
MIFKEGVSFLIQSNSVITNSPGLAIFFVITGLICAVKLPICPKNAYVITECPLTTEFVITEFRLFNTTLSIVFRLIYGKKRLNVAFLKALISGFRQSFSSMTCK